MKDTKVLIPSSEDLKQKLYALHLGKISMMTLLFFGFFPLIYPEYKLHSFYYLNICIIITSCIYLLIPTKIYMKSVNTFFYTSFIGCISSSIMLAYISSSFLPQNIQNVIIFLFIFISIFFLDVGNKYKKLNIYQNMIESSIVSIDSIEYFVINTWVKKLEETAVDKGLGVSLVIALIVGVLVIIVSTAFGGGLISAKIIMNKNMNMLSNAIICSLFIFLSLFTLSNASNEFLKIMARHRSIKKVDI